MKHNVGEIKYHTWCESLIQIVSPCSELNAWITCETREQKLVNAVSWFAITSWMVVTFCFDPRTIRGLASGDGVVSVCLDPPARSVGCPSALTAYFSASR